MAKLDIDLKSRYKDMPKNADFIKSEKFQSYFFGGFGNGKTESLCWRALKLAFEHPGTLGLLGRHTYRELQDSTERSFFDVCPPQLISDYRKQENSVRLINGSEIIFRAFDKEHKIKSMNLAWFGIDQIEEVTEEIYLQLLGRLRNKSCRYAFGVGNPEPGWVKRRFKDVSGKDQDLLFVEATTMENPHLPPDYVENLMKNYPDFWVKRYVYGDWSAFEGQVFTHFKEALHVIDPFEVPKTWKKEFIIDYGYRNPLACIRIAIDYDDNYFVIDEHYEREQVISWHAEKIKAMGYDKTQTCWIDPSCAAKNRTKNNIQVSIIDEFTDESIFTVPANNEIAGVLRVNEWFKEGRLKIFRNCVNTVKEVSEWRWKKVKPDWGKNLPEQTEDKADHICDSLKYFANSRPMASKKPLPANQPMIDRMARLKRTGKFKVKDWYVS